MHSGIRVASHTPVVQTRRNTVQRLPTYYASGLVTLTTPHAHFPRRTFHRRSPLYVTVPWSRLMAFNGVMSYPSFTTLRRNARSA